MSKSHRSALYIATTALLLLRASAQQDGLEQWCNDLVDASEVVHNATAAVCGSTVPECTVGDEWWSDDKVCIIPGVTASYSAWTNVCQGPSGVQEFAISSFRGADVVYGKMYVWRTYLDEIGVTVALDGATDSQQYLNKVEDAETPMMAVGISTAYNPLQEVAYTNAGIASQAALFTCLTTFVDLKEVCNPKTSVFGPNFFGGPGRCECKDPLATSTCEADDLSRNVEFFVTVASKITKSEILSCSALSTEKVVSTKRVVLQSCAGLTPPAEPSPEPSPTGEPEPSPEPAPSPLPEASPAPVYARINAPILSPASPDGPYARIAMNRMNSAAFTAVDCKQLADYLEFYSRNRVTFDRSVCDYQTQLVGATGSISTITLTFLYRSDVTTDADIEYLRSSLESANIWSMTADKLNVGCGFKGRYEDSLDQAYTICTTPACNVTAYDDAPEHETINFYNRACLAPPPSPSPRPSPQPSPIQSSPGPVPSPPPTIVPVKIQVTFTAQSDKYFSATNCAHFGDMIAQYAGAGMLHPFSMNFTCVAATRRTIAVLATVYDRTDAFLFLRTMSQPMVAKLLGSLFLVVDPLHLNSGAGCGASLVVTTSDPKLEILKFDSTNLDIYSCPTGTVMQAPAASTVVVSNEVTIIITSPNTVAHSACDDLSSALRAYLLVMNLPWNTAFNCWGPKLNQIQLTVTLVSDQSAWFFAINMMPRMAGFVKAAKVPCGSSVQVSCGTLTPMITDCPTIPEMCCAGYTGGSSGSTGTDAGAPVVVDERKVAARIVVVPPATYMGIEVTDEIAQDVFCPRVLRSLPAYIEGQHLDTTEYAVKACKGDKDETGQYVLFYADFNVTVTGVEMLMKYMKTQAGFKSLVSELGIPCGTVQVSVQPGAKKEVVILNDIDGNREILSSTSLGACAKNDYRRMRFV